MKTGLLGKPTTRVTAVDPEGRLGESLVTRFSLLEIKPEFAGSYFSHWKMEVTFDALEDVPAVRRLMLMNPIALEFWTPDTSKEELGRFRALLERVLSKLVGVEQRGRWIHYVLPHTTWDTPPTFASYEHDLEGRSHEAVGEPLSFGSPDDLPIVNWAFWKTRERPPKLGKERT